MLRIYDVIIDTVAGLRPVVERVAQHDADLARQMRRAAASVALNRSGRSPACWTESAEVHEGSVDAEPAVNVAEGSSSRGRNRGARYHTAAGSMREVGAAIDVAVALGYIDGVDEYLRDRLGLIAGTLMKNARS